MIQHDRQRLILWCIHGNLQHPKVWENLAATLHQQVPSLHIQTVNVWDTLTDTSWQWGKHFCTTVRSMSSQTTSHYLLGYSLGGRLGFHGLLESPELWSGATIVSADPGIADPQIRKRCLERDRTWANRVLSEPWEDLLAEWDRLPVFCNRPCITPRLESEFNRSKIAQAFEAYSKGKMDDLRSQLSHLTIPITYVTGADDQHYCQIGQDLTHQCPFIHPMVIPNAGHRVPWEQPDAFLNLLINILSPLSSANSHQTGSDSPAVKP